MARINWRVVLILFLLIAIVLVAVYENFIYKSKPVPNPNVDKIYEAEWLDENCGCLARGRLACGFQGYTLENGSCWNGNISTNPISKCSKYNCNGEIINYSG